MAKHSTSKLKADISYKLTRATRTIYFLIAFFAASIVIFDSGNLITKEAVVDRWSIATALLVINTITWFICSQRDKPTINSILITVLSLSLIGFAGLVTYWERGMASTSTILYVFPLLVVAIARNRHALLAVATLSVATYCFAAVKYFNDYFNEGYRIQLWGNLVLYSGIIFACAWLIMILTNLRQDSK